MKEKRESVRDFVERTKDSFTLKQFAMAAIVIFGTAAYIIFDYISLGFDASIFRDPAYWINLVIGQSAVTIIMFTVYGYTADREETRNVEAQRLRKDIFSAHCSLTRYSLSERFDDYVYVKNMERKKRAYTYKMQRKIHRAKSDKKLKRYEKEFAAGLEMIESIKVRYKKIYISDIFSRSTVSAVDDEDLSDGRAETTRRMLLNKIVCIIMFGVLLSTLSYEPKAFAGILLSSFIKLFQTAYAIYAGGSAGVTYVRGRLLTSLDNRAQFIQKFIENNMPSEEQRKAMDCERQTMEAAEAEKMLERRKLDTKEAPNNLNNAND